MNAPEPHSPQAVFPGLDLLSSAVILLDGKLLIRHLNPAAENLFAVSERAWLGRPLAQLAGMPPTLAAALDNALSNNWSYTGHNIAVVPGGEGDHGNHGNDGPLHLDCTVTPVDTGGARLLLEFRPIDQQLRAIREEREAVQQQANRDLIRNLAHEIKNPLGGIRGSAQLLERELPDPRLREYTQVIIKEADRLQDLMQRLLSSHRAMQPTQANIHEILERVRRLIHAEYAGVRVRRDYDLSLPELTGDREQLIQAILNIARNAAQSMNGQGEITFRTRALRQATIAKKRHRLALELQVIDNGPGIPEAIHDKIFYPLVSGREGGSGLGLTLAQSFVQQHFGGIEVDSRPGRTCFTILLPLSGGGHNHSEAVSA
ncbi:MAG: nitrogen regulation protein NR(II) [Candidatus Nitricoxidivorans perseverans]|uniref:Sensory histidine kinase/phosphatase NtrB n=1 Tax=Candidatus Nitricoxidivorans perseverans TaxID=2975601 RepID=A0AA49FKM3_9PROT|nr:MAG: nitrogen regulation protein NR(II) [Candidatus Nitricoxidivorans perseverans]